MIKYEANSAFNLVPSKSVVNIPCRREAQSCADLLKSQMFWISVLHGKLSLKENYL